ncbi:NAD(P)/FAD-dependent oxidoreductase [Calidifontibacter sp. DB0510]|uniref:NAD(P)/FAD-dependent oxidoreductase n=1 Tax=Metallococcus carri TaxID=1656884 RepID=A0A967B2J8_9MICO|nr:FAD-dependent oxidoreductase [Metallococcus carri]NHN57128.1 NAD(P)/FAD-dependent oxidoreductase [Metallococcus carri]NOP39003.1 NAD(P)/FAD-dependent oxidoreductase [Calidifontibacter sp. DB2511S]
MTPHRVVVVGHGMVAHRFVDDLTRATRRTGRPVEVTVLGGEPHTAYNRLMLSEVIAGRARLAGLTLPEHEDVDVRTGVSAVAVDRSRQVVHDSDGAQHSYDTVVLATGAGPRMPLDARGLHGVKALRTIDDCRELIAAASPGRPMIVLGGGLLGIELACGLRTRDVEVTIVHRADHLMEAQLDPTSADVVRNQLERNGIRVRLGVEVDRLEGESGRVTSAVLSDGNSVAADIVVACAGVTPRIELARAAGLQTRRGVVVGNDCRSITDASVAAIGDCAEPPEGCAGLLAPGWRQAAMLAAEIAGDLPPAEHRTDDVIQLKAAGLSVVLLGRVDPAHRVVRLSDDSIGRCLTLAVDDGVVTGAVCVGAADIAADLVSTYERGLPVPLDPAQLLVRAVAGTSAPAPSPRSMPASATVCRCNGVTKQAIVEAHVDGAHSVEQIAARTRATTGCGGCRDAVQGICQWMAEVDPSLHDRNMHATGSETSVS